MDLIEDVFKGNLVPGLAIEAGAIIFGPTVIQTMGDLLRASAQIQSPDSAHLPEGRRVGGIEPIQGETFD